MRRKINEALKAIRSMSHRNDTYSSPRESETRKAIVREALRGLNDEYREELTRELQALLPEDRRYLAGRLLPTQSMTDRAWLIIVWAFAMSW